jgi:hypothetical protein
MDWSPDTVPAARPGEEGALQQTIRRSTSLMEPSSAMNSKFDQGGNYPARKASKT